MSSELRILFVNDHRRLNNLYRSDLIDDLQSRGYGVWSLGIFNPYDFMLLIRNAVLRYSVVVSSNLRANLVCCLFFWLPGMAIVNGLGRNKRRKVFRKIVLLMFACCWRRFFVIQNYGDFRYFRRFSRAQVFWVPGSGGSVRRTGKQKTLMVSRPSKLPYQLAAVKQMVRELGLTEVSVVGLEEGDLLGLPEYLRPRGVTPQADLFTEGTAFLQPTGYGEGVPHTLVDAICSGMTVYMSRRDFIQFGFYKLDCEFSGSRFGSLHYCDSLKSTLSVRNVNREYLRIVEDCS